MTGRHGSSTARVLSAQTHVACRRAAPWLAAVQSKLAGVCKDMYKEVGAYPKCNQFHKFVEPDPMTWGELMEHMEKNCWSQNLQHRAAVQNKLAGVCEDMYKEVGA